MLVIERYAVYFAPGAETPLWETGCCWLGRDSRTGQSLPQPAVEGFSASQIAALTASPRLYGFHATLKPPFRLVQERTRTQLEHALSELAARSNSFVFPRFAVGQLDGFLVLHEEESSPQTHVLADACVVELDGFRRAAGNDELARRRARGLSARQEQLLAQFGYPFVLDQFRFHMTLTERLPPDDANRLRPWLAEYMSGALAAPARCDDLCLFVQERPGQAFRLLQRFPFKTP